MQQAKQQSKSAKRRARKAAAKSGQSGQVRARSSQPSRQRGKKWSLEVGDIDVPLVGKVGGIKLNSGRDARMVGLAERSVNMQMSEPVILRHPSKTGVIMRGTEYLGQISTGADVVTTGNILASILINPLSFPKTRLRYYSATYQRYRFTKAHIVYVADANATQSGSVIGFMDYDVDNRLTVDDPGNVNRAAAQYAQQPSKIWQSQRYALGIVDEYTDLFVNTTDGSEDRLVYQGVWSLIAATELPTSSALGTIYLDYEIELSIPSLENVQDITYQSASVVSTAVGTPAAPLGAMVLKDVAQLSYPPSNIEFTYQGGASSLLTFYGLEAGVYELNSVWQGQIAAGSGVQLFSTTWQVVGAGPDVGFLPSASSTSTTSTFSQSAATGQTASLVRNNFRDTLYLPQYTQSLSLGVVCGALGTGASYVTPMAVVFQKLATPLGFPVFASSSKLFGRARKPKMVFLQGNRPSREVVCHESEFCVGTAGKTAKQLRTPDIEDCHLLLPCPSELVLEGQRCPTPCVTCSSHEKT
jgi:hypothetical protein